MARPLWSRLPGYALCLSTLTGTDIRVLGAICLHIDSAGGGCFASVQTLAREAGVDRTQFFKSTKRLIAAGVIARESHRFDGRASLYRVAMDGAGVFKNTTPSAAEGVVENTTPPVSKNTTPGVAKNTTPEWSETQQGSGQKRHTPTINRSSNRSINRSNAVVGWGERKAKLQAAAQTAFADLRERRTATETQGGRRYHFDRKMLAALDERTRYALHAAGGAHVVAGSQDLSVDLNVARKNFVDAWVGFDTDAVPANVAEGLAS